MVIDNSIVFVPKKEVFVSSSSRVVIIPKPVIRKPVLSLVREPDIKILSLQTTNPYPIFGDMDLTNKEIAAIKASNTRYQTSQEKWANLSRWHRSKRDSLKKTFRTEKDLQEVKKYFNDLIRANEV